MPGLFTPAPVTGWWAEVSGIPVTPGGRTLTVTGAVPTVTGTLNKLVTPSGRSLTITGGTPTISLPRTVTPSGASLTLSGGTPVPVVGIVVTPSGASLTVTGGTPTVSTPQIFTPGGASLTVFGGSPGLVAAYFTPTDASLTLAGGTPTVVVSNNQSVTPSGASPAVTGGTPVVTTPRLVTPGGASLTVTGGAPTVSTPRLATPAGASLTITGGTPTVGIDRSLTPAGAALTATGGTPVVRLGTICAPTGAALALTGGTPTVTVSSASTVIPYTIPFIIPASVGAHYTDNFNRANNPSLGASWSTEAGTGNANLTLSGNAALDTTGSSGNVYGTAMSTVDHKVTVVMKGASAGDLGQILLRAGSTSLTTYVACDFTNGSAWHVFRSASDGSPATSSSTSWVDGDTISFEVQGTTALLKLNGSTIVTANSVTQTTGLLVDLYYASVGTAHGYDSFDAQDI